MCFWVRFFGLVFMRILILRELDTIRWKYNLMRIAIKDSKHLIWHHRNSIIWANWSLSSGDISSKPRFGPFLTLGLRNCPEYRFGTNVHLKSVGTKKGHHIGFSHLTFHFLGEFMNCIRYLFTIRSAQHAFCPI